VVESISFFRLFLRFLPRPYAYCNPQTQLLTIRAATQTGARLDFDAWESGDTGVPFLFIHYLNAAI